MPLVLLEGGFAVRIYLNDHPPAHVHVLNAGGEARIVLEPVRVDAVWDMKLKDVARARRLVLLHRGNLLKRWREIHERPDD